MGGPGSGVKWEKKGTVEGRQCLDVRELHKAYGIEPGNEIFVNFEWQGEQLTHEIAVDWTSCHYGGQRPWFVCGDCEKRVAKLYFRGKRFACRICCDLTYKSSQQSHSRFGKFFA